MRERIAAFVKYGNKTDWPLEATYAVLCNIYVSSGFNELSSIATLLIWEISSPCSSAEG